jgi:protein-tyrosine phosphatase
MPEAPLSKRAKCAAPPESDDLRESLRGRCGTNESLFGVLKELAAGITKGENAVLPCQGGISRSLAVVIALLAMRQADWPLIKPAKRPDVV